MDKELSFCSLRSREVINVPDGRRLGRIIDITLDRSGRVTGLVTPGGKRSFFRMCDDIFIPWCDIECIGEDVILVCLGRGKRDDKKHKDNCCCDECLRLAGDFMRIRRRQRGNDRCNDRCDDRCNDRCNDRCDRGHDNCRDRGHDDCDRGDGRRAKSHSYSQETEEYEQDYKDYYNKYDDRRER